jgi:DNA-binding response OmpR family regulator
MSAATIVFAREDLSILGSGTAGPHQDDQPSASGTDFFNLLRDRNPDVIVLDLSRNPSAGVATILKIRQRCQIPILVACDLRHPAVSEFRIAGAAECIATPVDLLLLNERLQRIIHITRGRSRQQGATPEAFVFGGLTFYPHRDLLAVPGGAALAVTTSESRLLSHLVSHPWRLCPRAELIDVLYGTDPSASARALDTVINRLRRKLVLLRGATAHALIKTEFRRGYLLVAEVTTSEDRPAAA